MDAAAYTELRGWATAWGLTQPRILALFIAVPLFARQLLPGLALRTFPGRPTGVGT